MTLITLMHTNEFILVFMLTRTLDMFWGDIVGIGVKPFGHLMSIKDDNS